MMALVLFLTFVLLVFLGVPIAFSLGLSALLYLVVMDIPLNVIPQKMYVGIDSFTLLCIPGFVLAGNLMNVGGITNRIIQFANSVIGFIRGGLGLATVGSSMVFAGISGTALAETASLGSVLIPAMKRERYDAGFASALVASASTIGPIIPPSLPMIIVGTLTGISVGKMFVAGIVPGVLIGILLMAVVYVISVRRGYPKGERQPLSVVVKSFFNAFWAIMMTVLILYGILGGLFTPTEASVMAVLYALVVGKFIYRELRFRDLPKIFVSSMISSAGIMILVGLANLFGWILVSEQIPQLIAETILSISTNKYVVLLLINLFLLFVGLFMETIAALVILFPVLLPVALEIGMDPVQFGVMVVLNLVIGLVTPPVGVCLFVAAGIGKVTLGRAARALLPFLAVELIVLFLVAYVPGVTLYLPKLLG
ncbi:MAG: C4-dicarboxylate ABC transporter permease [Paenibacillaceae bacterium ZCTH02-B3]|nr:MAG: C4-dicarboxylate ABC transporter permease [Paenibacillaceae bacterium ZCTH02-B3]